MTGEGASFVCCFPVVPNEGVVSNDERCGGDTPAPGVGGQLPVSGREGGGREGGRWGDGPTLDRVHH